MTKSESLTLPATGIRFWDDLDETTKSYLLSCMYQLFPKLIKNKNASKYKKASMWLCSRYSIINPSFRDIFSAGGVGDIYVNDELFVSNVPKVICKLIPILRSLIDSFSSHNLAFDEISIYSEYYSEGVDLKNAWLDIIEEYISTYNDLSLTLNDLLQNKLGKVVKTKTTNGVYKYNCYLINEGVR